MSLKKRVQELERKSKFYDTIAESVALEKDMVKEFDEITNNHRLNELEKAVGAAKDTHTRNIIVTLACFALIFFCQIIYRQSGLKEN